MKMVDANIVLRYLLDDVPDMVEEALNILKNNDVFILNEVFAEIVYVLEKVYKIDRGEIKKVLQQFIKLDNIINNNKDVLIEALNINAEIKIDFIDSLLYSYKKCLGYEVYTFDNKLKKLLKK